MIYTSLVKMARGVSQTSLATPPSRAEWEETLSTRREQWREMLGLSPLPERTPLHATVTGTLDRGDYVVEKVHFQCLPGCYVPGNLYRPAKVEGPLPTVLYVCGHTKGKVSPTYQANPRWFGQHGYVALVLDTIELGEAQGDHHGTYSKGRWDWYSRGYTPAGAEVWCAMRALDYLSTRPDVDPERMGVTGLSGGGAISWFLGAADERVKVVVPVCQTGTVEHVVTDRAVDGHCDCAFWVNNYGWCTPDIGSLIAPRHLLVASGTEDVLWRPYAFRDALHRIRHLYRTLGIPERAELVEDMTPHGYTPKLRKAIFEWFNRHLKGDATPVTDDVTEYVEPEENLLVFNGRPPADDRMGAIDRVLVSRSGMGEWASGRAGDVLASSTPALSDSPVPPFSHSPALPLARLRATSFRRIPEAVDPVVREVRAEGSDGTYAHYTAVFETGDGLTLRVRWATPRDAGASCPVVVFPLDAGAASPFVSGSRCKPALPAGVAYAAVEVRGTGATSVGEGLLWTLRRSYPLVGCTLPERQVYDLLCGIAALRRSSHLGPVCVYGKGAGAVTVLYAALLDPAVAEVILEAPPETHEDPATPELLGVLRVGDLPENAALLCPRPLTFVGAVPPAYERTRQAFAQAGAPAAVRSVARTGEWMPAGG